MERISVEPRTAEWHEYRSESWTASAAATLVAAKNATLLRDYAATKGVTLDIAPLLKVGMDEFFENTLWTAWAQKNGRIPQFKGNEHTTRGTRFEELVVVEFEKKEMMTVEREVTAFSSEYRGLLASFDALAPQSSDPTVHAPFGFPVEAKCPAFVSRKKLWDKRKEGGLAIMGLPYYWCQVQHQIYVAQAPYGWFVASGVDEVTDPVTGVVTHKVEYTIIEKIPRDDEYLAAYVAAAKFFHSEFIEAYKEPPKLPADEAMIESLVKAAAFDAAMASDDPEVAVDLYLEAVATEELAKQRRADLEAKVLEAASRMRAAGVDVVKLADGVEEVKLVDRLKVTFTPATTSTSWQKVAAKLAVAAGHKDVPADVIDACQTKKKESVKLKEVV